MTGRPYITDTAFDPTKLLDSNTLGVAPANTTLTVLFFQNETDSVNVAQGNLNTVSISAMTFPNADGIRDSLQGSIRASLEVSNDEAIVGSTSIPTSEEIRYRAYAAKAAQQRSVTRNDYEAYIYMMPPAFGSIKRASVINDPSSSNRRLSIYVISEDSRGNLISSNSTIKENTKSWLNKNKMLNDNIDIYDAKIMNIGFEYEIIVHPTRDKIEVLNSVNQRLQTEFANKMYIGEPFYLTNIYNAINKVEGVVDTTKVTPILKTGTGYNTAPVTIEEMKSPDGTYLKAPRNVIFEIKNFNSDIRGTAV
jgi:phage-related baseplate assembly protein